MMQSDVDHEVVGAGDLAGVHGTRKRELTTDSLPHVGAGIGSCDPTWCPAWCNVSSVRPRIKPGRLNAARDLPGATLSCVYFILTPPRPVSLCHRASEFTTEPVMMMMMMALWRLH